MKNSSIACIIQTMENGFNAYEECKACGKCCNIIVVAMTLDEAHAIDDYMRKNNIEAKDNGLFICPLLREDGKCSVYPARSMTCRLHSCSLTRTQIIDRDPSIEERDESELTLIDMRRAFMHGDFRDAREIDYFGEGLIDEKMQAYIDALDD